VTLSCRFGRTSDIVFANGLDLEARIVAALLRKPALHKVVGDRAWEIARVRGWFQGTLDDYQSSKKSLRLRFLDRLRDMSLACARLIVTPSEYLAKIVRGWQIESRPIEIIHNSTPLENAVGQLPKLPPFQGKTVCTVCRLVPWKGVDRLIKALTVIDNTRLVVAGEGAERHNLMRQARMHGVSNRVVFLGQIGQNEVNAVLKQADVFVLNSSYEGLPHVVLEAMAAGVLVVATDVGGTAEVVTHRETGLLVQSGDDAALLSALRFSLAEAPECREMVSKARRLIEKRFSEEVCFASYEAALLAAARRGGRASGVPRISV
jgi:glycosyltransferase involved in cell wall biosynthesis